MKWGQVYAEHTLKDAKNLAASEVFEKERTVRVFRMWTHCE